MGIAGNMRAYAADCTLTTQSQPEGRRDLGVALAEATLLQHEHPDRAIRRYAFAELRVGSQRWIDDRSRIAVGVILIGYIKRGAN